MTRLSKENREMSDPKVLKQLWQPAELCLDPIMEETGANRYSKHFFGQNSHVPGTNLGTGNGKRARKKGEEKNDER